MTSPVTRHPPSGRTSPSFLVAVLLTVAVATGYVYWRYFRLTDVKRSERVVRELNKDLGRQMGAFRKAVRVLKEDVRKGKDAAQAVAALDKERAAAEQRIDELADGARARLDELADLPINTQRNRSERIDDKVRETKALLEQEAESARQALTGQK